MIHSKECFKCKTIKPLSDFYKHKMMLDGHLNKCKECNKKDVQKNRADKIDYYREYDRRRAKEQHRIDAAQAYSRWWRNEFKQKYECHLAVSNALRRGDLQKQPCIRCGSNEFIVGHHEDYSKPLDVWWLCEVCHKQRHRELLQGD